MITRSNLVDQLRDYQVRYQHKWARLSIFSPKPQITTRADVITAVLWAILFFVLVLSSYVALYFRYLWLGFGIICSGILLYVCLEISRQISLRRRRHRRLLLPLSM